jgi:hypothetical protein
MMNCSATSIVAAMKVMPTSMGINAKQDNVFEQAARFAIGESVLFSRIPDYSKDFVLIVTRKNRSETAVFDGRPDASYRAAKVPRRMMKEIIAAVNTNVDKFMSEHHTHGPLIGSDENHFLLYRRNVLQYVDENIRWNVDVAPYKIGKIITDTYLRTAFVDYGVFCTLDTLYQALVGSFVPVKCAACDTQALQEKMPRCGRCRQVRYCSRKIAEYENEFDIRRTQYVKSDRNE